MRGNIPTSSPFASIALVLALLFPGFVAAQKTKEMLRFAAKMAESGNWREARYRWEHIVRQMPDDSRVLNNLAVASEAMGDFDAARDYYDRSLRASQVDARIVDNHRRFLRAMEMARPQDSEEPGDPGKMMSVSDASARKTKGKMFRVQVGIPVPPRLEIEGNEALLVASFVSEDTSLLDVNRELVRFLRGEFRQTTSLDVLDVVPPPAIPEQSIDDLLANSEFWKYLSREYGADLIVSGVISYDREDTSGFEDVDMRNSVTGQRYRQGVFVEREDFEYSLDVFFMDGATGTLLFRDRMQRRVRFRGSANDPITAFYELSESIVGDVLAVVTHRVRYGTRVIFGS